MLSITLLWVVKVWAFTLSVQMVLAADIKNCTQSESEARLKCEQEAFGGFQELLDRKKSVSNVIEVKVICDQTAAYLNCAPNCTEYRIPIEFILNENRVICGAQDKYAPLYICAMNLYRETGGRMGCHFPTETTATADTMKIEAKGEKTKEMQRKEYCDMMNCRYPGFAAGCGQEIMEMLREIDSQKCFSNPPE